MKLSHPKTEGILQASKWLSHRALLSEEEMEALLTSLPPFSIYNVSEIVSLDEGIISREDFLKKYQSYVAALKKGQLPDEGSIKSTFSAAISAVPKALYAMEVKDKKVIFKAKEAVIQLSLHHFVFSVEERAFHSMVHAKNGITWGLQFSYPQIYSNSLDHEIVEVYKNSDCPNTLLFKTLAKWIRSNTIPTPFIASGTPLKATFRLGKKSLEWAKKHPQLQREELKL